MKARSRFLPGCLVPDLLSITRAYGRRLLFDDVVVTRTTTANDIADNTIPPAKFTGAARTEYIETFETPLRQSDQRIGAPER